MKPLQKVDDIVLIILALISIVLFVFELTVRPSADIFSLIRGTDIFIALIFLGEFVMRFSQSKDKASFMKENWWQLLASIPVTTSGTQVLRGLMIFRVLRIMRFGSIVVRLNHLSKSLSHFMKETRLPLITTLLATTLLGGSLLLHHFENTRNPHIESFFDSFYLASGAMTNTGIGTATLEPITTEGKMLTVVLMFSGVIIFGLFVAFFASYLIHSKEK